jgi:hypothetical protein
MSQNQNIDPLQIEDLPSDPREMALRLLGMTSSELKDIDSKVISGHNYVGGTRADYNRIAREVITQITPTLPLQPKVEEQIHTVEDTFTQLQPQPVQTITQVEPVAQDVDKDQLEFDFYKKIKPEDIEFQLRVINSKLDNLENLLQEFLSRKNKKKFLIHADTAQ